MTLVRRVWHALLVLAGLAIAAEAVATLPEHLWEYLFVLPVHQYDEVVSDTLAAAVRVAGFSRSGSCRSSPATRSARPAC